MSRPEETRHLHAVDTRLPASQDVRADADGEDTPTADARGDSFPRSHLLRAIQRHPVATAAAVAAVVFVGPATIGRWGLRGLHAANRHATAMAPLIGQLARASGRR